MNWIKQNTFLAGLLAIAVIGVATLGFFFVKARGQYADAKDRLSSAFSAKARLESQKPYPNEKNANDMRKLVTDYRTTAEVFISKMLSAQAVMPAGVTVARFQDDLGLKVDAVINAAELSGVTLPEGFYLGMDRYRAQVPLDDAVDRLQFQLDATVRLTDLLFANGVTRFGLERQAMPFEMGDGSASSSNNRRGRNAARGGGNRPEEEEEPVSEAYPMELVFEAPQRGFQKIVNALSNTEAAMAEEAAPAGAEEAGEYYFVTRWMRVENQAPTGPERSDPEDEEDDDGVVDPDAEDDAGGAGDELNMVFGAEKVRAYLALDLVRFLKPKGDVVAKSN